MTVDAAIIGGGPAGAACAWRLAQAGARVTLFEKQAQAHHKVCGEFLSGEGLPALFALGVDLEKLGAPLIPGFRLHGPSRSFEHELPHAGRGYSRFALDEALLKSAEKAGARVVRRAVTDIARAPDGYAVMAGDDVLLCHNLVCATGKHEFLPVQRRKGRDGRFVGFKVHLELAPREQRNLDGFVELFVFKGGYGGLAPIENGAANLCFLVQRTSARVWSKNWAEMQARLGSCKALKQRLDGARPLFWPPAVVANVPYGFLRRRAVAENLYCVGDQLAVIPSLAGEGVTMALLSGARAARCILDGLGADVFHVEMAKMFKPQVNAGYRIHRLFRSPRASDLGAKLAALWPGIVDRVFLKTRTAA